MNRVLPLLMTLLVVGCGMPRDPEGTSDRVASAHLLRVGVVDNPPWSILRNGQPTGLEADIVRGFAKGHGAKILWAKASETNLAEALHGHRLDLAIGGFDSKTVWHSVAGVSQPFAKGADGRKHVILTAPGENELLLELDTYLSETMRGQHPSPA